MSSFSFVIKTCLGDDKRVGEPGLGEIFPNARLLLSFETMSEAL